MVTNPAIIIMAKTPRPGAVKTRLQPFLDESQSAEIAVCFLKDAVEKSLRLCKNVIVAYAPAETFGQIKKLVPSEVVLVEQSGGDLGERMKAALLSAEKKGFSPLVMIGTDSPTLPDQFIQKAISSLRGKETQIVIGATDDGGFYLIGLANWTDDIFDNVRWSSPDTFADTVRNIVEIFGSKPLEIPRWRDVDTPIDLKNLMMELQNQPDLERLAPHTTAWLKENGFFI